MRYPAVAGQFYEGDPKTLRKQIERCFFHPLGPGRLPELGSGRKIKGMVVPHAGYMYSGPVAAHAYSALAKDGLPQGFVIIGPNHTGYGLDISMTNEDFSTPLGTVGIHRGILSKLQETGVKMDPVAHRFEHSIEVQLPFLQYLHTEISMVPITMLAQDMKSAVGLGRSIAQAIEGEDVVVIASTDFSHYVPKEVAVAKDQKAIEAILSLDVQKFYEVVRDEGVSMCGYGPVAAMLTAVHGKHATLLKYATSGDVQPMRDVVGYGAIVIE